MAKAKNQQQVSYSMEPVGSRPSAEALTQIALNELVETVVGSQPSNRGELVVLMNDTRELTDPVRVRAFLTRALLRAACFAIDHEVYGPLVRKIPEAGRAACSRPGDDATPKGKECWSEVSSALVEQHRSGPDTLQQRNADRCMVVSAALSDPQLRLPVSWFNAGMDVLWVLADDARQLLAAAAAARAASGRGVGTGETPRRPRVLGRAKRERNADKSIGQKVGCVTRAAA